MWKRLTAKEHRRQPAETARKRRAS
jgi:hypothetical protein